MLGLHAFLFYFFTFHSEIGHLSGWWDFYVKKKQQKSVHIKTASTEIFFCFLNLVLGENASVYFCKRK